MGVQDLLLGSSVTVDGQYVGTLRYLIEPDKAIVELWINEGASEELLVLQRRIARKGNLRGGIERRDELHQS